AIAEDSLVAKTRRSRSPAVCVWLAIARAMRATAVTPPQPHSHKSEVSSRRLLRGARKSGSGGVGWIAMGLSVGESLKTLAESRNSRFGSGSERPARVFCRRAG